MTLDQSTHRGLQLRPPVDRRPVIAVGGCKIELHVPRPLTPEEAIILGAELTRAGMMLLRQMAEK